MTTISDRDHFVQTYSIDTISGSTRIDTSFHGSQGNKIEPILSSGSLGVIPYNQALLRTLAGGFKHFPFSPIIVG
jgi:hypothetical protein